MLLRLACLGVTNALALLRLLPMSDRDKDAEILALRHQIMVLERQLHGERVRFNPVDRAWLAALLHPLPRTALPWPRLLVRPASKNGGWGYRRIHGELLVLGVKVAASTVWEILGDAGVDPAPERTNSTWARFLRSQAQTIVAADFFETVTSTGARLYALAVIEHATPASGFSASRPIRAQPGSPRLAGTWSWTSTTPAAR
ncbi:hypothetical protein [Actinoplanes sp. NPDC020271]|uniref:hypothetical protein n=1 Tax=Actinoplanes sp. NPDC020271 TaxID=3363896 RepID=UPI0037B6036F